MWFVFRCQGLQTSVSPALGGGAYSSGLWKYPQRVWVRYVLRHGGQLRNGLGLKTERSLARHRLLGYTFERNPRHRHRMCGLLAQRISLMLAPRNVALALMTSMTGAWVRCQRGPKRLQKGSRQHVKDRRAAWRGPARESMDTWGRGVLLNAF